MNPVALWKERKGGSEKTNASILQNKIWFNRWVSQRSASNRNTYSCIIFLLLCRCHGQTYLIIPMLLSKAPNMWCSASTRTQKITKTVMKGIVKAGEVQCLKTKRMIVPGFFIWKMHFKNLKRSQSFLPPSWPGKKDTFGSQPLNQLWNITC